MKWIFFFLLMLSCTAKNDDKNLLSPCVSKHGGPCDRIPVNNWWINAKYKI